MNRFLLALLCLLLCTACAPMGRRFNPRADAAATGNFSKMHAGDTFPAEWLKPSSEPYRIGPGDKLDTEVMEVPETRQNCIVLPDGMIYFQTLHGFKAAGMTLPEVKAALEKGLQGEYRNPQVSIILRAATSRKFYLMGRIRNPGVYQLDMPTTILEALSKAGGLVSERFLGTTEDLADLPHSFLVRDGKFVPVNFSRLMREGDTSQNIYLKDGDYIYLPSSSASRAYVLGAVNQPKAVDFSEQLTLMSAIANAGDIAKYGYAQRVVIIRDSLTEPSVAVVNFDQITSGKAPDILLEPQDIVWVPNSPMERVDLYLNQIISTFVRTVAANEGLRAVRPNSTGIQTSVGISDPTQ